MKNTILYSAAIALFMTGGLITDVQAQRYDKEDKYWAASGTCSFKAPALSCPKNS